MKKMQIIPNFPLVKKIIKDLVWCWYKVIAAIFIVTVFQATDKACCKYHRALRLPTWNSVSMLEFSGSNIL